MITVKLAILSKAHKYETTLKGLMHNTDLQRREN